MSDDLRKKVSKALFRADDMVAKPDFAWGETTAASYAAMADAAIAAHLEELRLGTIAALAKQIAIRDYSNRADQRAALDILAILKRAGVDV